MTHDILVVDEDQQTVVIGFENSSGEIEYTTYQAIDGGVIGDPDSDIGSILASDNDITGYQDYELHIIEG